MSKTFSNADGNRDIRVIDDSDRGFVIRALDHDGARSIAVTFNNDTAPALDLAILEAAGYTEDDRDDSGLTHFAIAMTNLRLGIAQQERATAEAEAQAKLEAEALELFKASGAYGSDRFFLKFSDLEETTQSAWLAVARRAREINKEEK